MLTPEEILKLKSEHPGRELHYFKTAGGEASVEVVIQVPVDEEYQRFLDELNDPARKGTARRTLVVNSVVWPRDVDFLSVLQRRPGVIQPLADEIAEHAGLQRIVERKKL